MYRPNFCAECGTKVERKVRWRLWTSRSFCTDCARIFRRVRLLRPLIAGLTIFGLGLAAGRAIRPSSPPLIVERTQMSPVAINDAGAQETTQTTTNDAPAPTPQPSYGPDGTATERPTDPTETVSLCGARTQKGTPCQRRVRGTGRCWQHKGMPAIIPQQKLIITGN